MRNGLYHILLWVVLTSGCSSDPTIQASAQTRLQLGLEYLAHGDILSAQRNLERAEAARPNDYRIQLAMARLYQVSGDNPSAQMRYEQALKLAALNSLVINNYGAFLCGLGHYERAQHLFNQTRKMSQLGAKADSFENAGYCYLKAGKYGHARQSLSFAIQTDKQKGAALLAESEKRFKNQEIYDVRFLLDVYQHNLPVSAESLWMEIRFAALTKQSRDVKHYGAQLAQHFPLSSQYQQFLSNEY